MRLVLVMLIALLPFRAYASSRAESDARAVEIYRAGLLAAAEDMRSIANGERRHMLSAEEKDRVRATWSSFLDYLLALDSVGGYQREQKGEPAEQGRADGDFEAYLREKHRAVHARSNGARIIEAVSEGVSFTTLEHSAAADSFAVLRPRATKRDKAIAIDRAFAFIGRPYDFNFDFQSHLIRRFCPHC